MQDTVQSKLNRFKVQLKLLRLSTGLSQQELSKKLKVSLRSYQRLETGEATPSLDQLLAMTDIFQIKLDDFFHFTDENDSFIEVSEEELLSHSQGREYIKFADFVKQKVEASGETKGLVKFTQRLNEFQFHNLSLSATDFVSLARNIKASELTDNTTNIIKNSIDDWVKEEKVRSVSLVNRCWGKDRYFFKGTRPYQSKLEKFSLDVYSCVFCINQDEHLVINFLTNKKPL